MEDGQESALAILLANRSPLPVDALLLPEKSDTHSRSGDSLTRKKPVRHVLVEPFKGKRSLSKN